MGTMQKHGCDSDHVRAMITSENLALGTDRDSRLTCLERAYITGLLGGTLIATENICWPTRLERAYITGLSGGMLIVTENICQPTCLEHAYIIGAVGWHAYSDKAYML